MERMQIYLTEQEKATLSAFSSQSGKKRSELIREAIDEYIARASKDRRRAVLASTAGIWKDRDDLPDFHELRKELNGLEPPYSK
ncbi:MAG: ribbon-helix-helix protein, CopG family [Chloroflexi bacterium]|nr:ribbon-helix-helix protein, CopG family [Chloroflexota bacterium]